MDEKECSCRRETMGCPMLEQRRSTRPYPRAPSSLTDSTGSLRWRCGCGRPIGAACSCADRGRNPECAPRHGRNSPFQVGNLPPHSDQVLRFPAEPLDRETRSLHEPRFGHDFSKVSIHAVARAAASARSLNATAYTVGEDIAFDSGQYSPATLSGRHLLAGELAHVVYQSRGGLRPPSPLVGNDLERSLGRPKSAQSQWCPNRTNGDQAGDAPEPHQRNLRVLCRQSGHDSIWSTSIGIRRERNKSRVKRYYTFS
jgi:hypothetical protein